MKWLRRLHFVLGFSFGSLFLVGCFALTTTPITLPIWFFWALFAGFMPDEHSSWHTYTLLVCIQLLLGALFGIFLIVEGNVSGAAFFLPCVILSALLGKVWADCATVALRSRRILQAVIGAVFVVGCVAVMLRAAMS